MHVWQAIWQCIWKKYASGKGRASRGEWLAYCVFYLCFCGLWICGIFRSEERRVGKECP